MLRAYSYLLCLFNRGGRINETKIFAEFSPRQREIAKSKLKYFIIFFCWLFLKPSVNLGCDLVCKVYRKHEFVHCRYILGAKIRVQLFTFYVVGKNITRVKGRHTNKILFYRGRIAKRVGGGGVGTTKKKKFFFY